MRLRPSLALGLLSFSLPLAARGAAAPPTPTPHPVPAVALYRAREASATPESVLAWLREGNARFAAGLALHGGYSGDARERIRASAKGQRPLAAVLSCIDSRNTPEVVFDATVGDLFTARVGANVINDDIVGSLEIAVESGARVVVVMGHTDCGGVKAACNDVELGLMTQLLARVKPAIATAHGALEADADLARLVGERSTSNRRYVAHVSHANARQSTEQLAARSPLLRERIAKGEILLLTGMYDVDTGRVAFEPANRVRGRKK